jgi:20S proteasome alpha/beta subunit
VNVPTEGGKIQPWQMIVGATDHMLTVESTAIEFESPEKKVYGVNKYCVAMISGDSSAQAILLRRTLAALGRKGYKYEQIVSTEEIANIYAQEFREHRRAIAAERLLTPLGLTPEAFMQNLGKLNARVAARLTEELLNAQLQCETIIAGLDELGSHIYVVRDPGQVMCADREGFAAVGIGADHAESQFMFARYSSETLIGESISLVYSAKKHAETAPGVGPETALVHIGPWGGWGVASSAEKAEIHAIYEEQREAIDTANAEAARKTHDYVDRIFRGAQKPDPGAPAPPPPSPTTPTPAPGDSEGPPSASAADVIP